MSVSTKNEINLTSNLDFSLFTWAPGGRDQQFEKQRPRRFAKMCKENKFLPASVTLSKQINKRDERRSVMTSSIVMIRDVTPIRMNEG